MASKVKRTYNLDPETVRRVRELADEYAVAASQDAVIELAVGELERRLLEQREADAWAAASSDPEYQREVGAIETAYRTVDAETWPR
jgi:predicted transcriptional regulator